jgi:hypothetical protein
MAGRRPVSSIGREWLRLTELARSDATRPEARNAWAALWRAHVEGDRLAQTDVQDVLDLCSLGHHLAMRDGDPRAALDCVERFFEHPLAGGVDLLDQAAMRERAARCWFALGDEEEAIGCYRQLLAETPRLRRRSHRAMVRNGLRACCREQRSGDVVPAPLAAFARELVATFPVRKIIVRSIRSDRTTYGELAAALQETIRKRKNRRRDRRLRRVFMRWRLQAEREGRAG